MILRRRAGFTIVEVLVTIVVTSLFVIAIAQVSTVQSRLSASYQMYNTADLLAYNNLRAWANGKAPTWFTCTYVSGNPQPMTLLSSSASVAGLNSPVSQTVVATAPYGCGGGVSTTGYPIKIVSTVSYDGGRIVQHATYATY